MHVYVLWVSLSALNFGLMPIGTYLDPANLVLHKVYQEPFRHLSTPLLHALHQLRFGRL